VIDGRWQIRESAAQDGCREQFSKRQSRTRVARETRAVRQFPPDGVIDRARDGNRIGFREKEMLPSPMMGSLSSPNKVLESDAARQ
jgi:hypothetical protein